MMGDITITADGTYIFSGTLDDLAPFSSTRPKRQRFSLCSMA